ncbi:hypothetical protein ACIQOU_17725 [Streptomyces sp. NPDC091279]|uniref:hypothetical protein n=1 Tax=unclassified Streptomyces TaxID=2593676 RepID=UPI003802A5DE
MNKIRHVARAIAALLTLAASVLAAPGSASAAAGPYAQIGTFCTSWEGIYGKGRYTFTDLRTCVQVGDKQGRSAMYFEVARNTYWWAGAWYNSTPGYPAIVSGTAKMSANFVQGGPTVNVRGNWEQTSRSGRLGFGSVGMLKCGVRTLEFTYHQVGAYHGADRAIDVKRTDNDFVLPCTFDN